jgi:hypothetical protein
MSQDALPKAVTFVTDWNQFGRIEFATTQLKSVSAALNIAAFWIGTAFCVSNVFCGNIQDAEASRSKKPTLTSTA